MAAPIDYPTLFSDSEYRGILEAGKKIHGRSWLCVCWCVSAPALNRLSVYSLIRYKQWNETKLKPFHSVEHLLWFRVLRLGSNEKQRMRGGVGGCEKKRKDGNESGSWICKRGANARRRANWLQWITFWAGAEKKNSLICCRYSHLTLPPFHLFNERNIRSSNGQRL